MSNALSIAAVTAVLKNLLNNGLDDHSVNTVISSGVAVTAIAPDLINTGNGDGPRLNLYLYQVTPNQGWRNAGLPGRNSTGQRLSNPPLALDLHYLLTAYGMEDLQAEILLGYGMQFLHERPVLDRDAIRAALGATPAMRDLLESNLAEQIEQVKITPESMGAEDVSKLWTAFQASYRPSAAYRASAVLIEADKPVVTALPVLTIGRDDTGPTVTADLLPPYPALTGIQPPRNQPSAAPGDTLHLLGRHLDGSQQTVVFTQPHLAQAIEVAPQAVASRDIAVTVGIGGTGGASWPAGVYMVHVRLERDGKTQQTNALPVALAPRIDTIAAATDGDVTTFSVTTAADVIPQQSAALIVGEHELVAAEHDAPTATLTFTARGLPAGRYYVRLRVAGVDSQFIDRSSTPPRFIDSQQVQVS